MPRISKYLVSTKMLPSIIEFETFSMHRFSLSQSSRWLDDAFIDGSYAKVNRLKKGIHVKTCIVSKNCKTSKFSLNGINKYYKFNERRK